MSRFHTSIIPYRLHFKQPAGTSRGVYQVRDVWYVLLTASDQPGRVGMGECAPLPDLSCDAMPREAYEQVLADACRSFENDSRIDVEALSCYPSILFGLETALRHFEAGSYSLWDTPFARGEAGIPINGLIWMGEYEQMLAQIEAKLAAGCRCVKLKIGAIDFEKELSLLKYIRQHYPASAIELRVDANGAFSPTDAMDKLSRLATLDLHSIEQPIRAGQWEQMAKLTASTPLPIALDEELIGITPLDDKRHLLDTIRPQYIILKPSLHGGIHGCTEWIREAEERRIGWWITSALESNIGLNAIAQWSATFHNPLPQGLGTGQLFTNNIEMPLTIRQDCLYHDPAGYPNETITVDGKCYRKGTFHLLPRHRNPSYGELRSFLADWYSDSPFMQVQTSGSTGIPKQLTVRKEQMRASARMTCDYMGLRPGDKALLCLALIYIAGKMMVVRALTNGLNLIPGSRSTYPLAHTSTSLQFASMVPLQVIRTCEAPLHLKRLRRVGVLLIGGGEIHPITEDEMRTFPNPVYASYGMTETLSHVALRRLNGPEASPYYTPLPGVTLSLSDDCTLVIDAPHVSDEILVTNDIAELLPNGRFLILGRKDNTINSGGVKIQIEEVEERLRSVLSVNFAITSVPHPQLGEAVVMLVCPYPYMDMLQVQVCSMLPKYEQPKHIVVVDAIPQTASGKIDRSACKRLAAELNLFK